MQEEIIKFIKSYDFMRLGQAISRHQWQAAAMTVRRMEQQTKLPGLEGFARPLAGIRQAIMRKDEREAKQILANVTARRVRMLEQVRQEETQMQQTQKTEEMGAAADLQDIMQESAGNDMQEPRLVWKQGAEPVSIMKIRTATMDDLAQITAVEAECFPAAEAATEKDFAARLAVYPEHFWLLEQNGELIGFVNGMVTDEPDLRDEMYENASLHKADGDWQMIFGVNTRPEFRCRGYAEKMLRRVIEDARAQGRKGVVLTCKDKLIHYYAKFGFVNEGVSESVHGNVTWYQMRLCFGLDA